VVYCTQLKLLFTAVHPNLQLPLESVLPCCDDLPFMEDSRITSAHVQLVVSCLQGEAGPRSAHWRDAVLRHESSSGRLHEAVTALCRLLCNSLVAWDSVRALLSSQLIALDKCHGVRLIGIGETLRQLIGKIICLVTRSDASVVCGLDQLCAGLQCKIEGDSHTMEDLFDGNKNVPSCWVC